MFDFDKHEVCVADGPKDTYVLIAIRPERLSGEYEVLVWNDGDHQRSFAIRELLEDTQSQFRFRDERGQVFTLEPMNAKNYKSRVRPKTRGPELSTDRAVRDFFLQPRAW